MPDVTGTSQVLTSRNIALPWWNAGCSVVPIATDGTKAPTRDWKNLQKSRLNKSEVDLYWDRTKAGVAVICGAISGNLEMTELEYKATTNAALSKVRDECEMRGVRELWEQLIIEGYAEWSPSGGIHILYRIADHEVPGNMKLARRVALLDELNDEEFALLAKNPDKIFYRVLAETRGEGGYVIVAPTGGQCHPSGQSWSTVAGQQGVIPTITWAERQAIHAAITAALDESPPPPPPTPRREILLSQNGPRPGDEFNAQVSWGDILWPEGWSVSHRTGTETFWVRPGKDPRDGHSASTGYAGDADRLYVWSSSTGLPTEEPLSKFFVWAHYNFNGDMSAAASSLAKRRQTPTRDIDTFTPASLNGTVGSPPLHGGKSYPRSDTGNGQRMKDLLDGKFLYNTTAKRWYKWDGTTWVEDRKLEIKYAAEKVSEQIMAEAKEMERQATTPAELKAAEKYYAYGESCGNESKIVAMVNRFASQPGVSVNADEFDKELNLLNVNNGVLNLTTGELVDHDPKFMITQKFNANRAPEADAPKFKQFMADVLPDEEVRGYVQRALGYTLLGQADERAMFLLHGKSGTGKSQLITLMTELFGTYAVTAPASTFRLKRNETTLDLHRLRLKRFVSTSEMPEGAQLDDELIKRITSGADEVTSRGHYEEFQTWKPRCAIWIATNFLPRVSSDDNAIWRRAKTIEMGTEFGGPDGRPQILAYWKHLYTEADGILNWLLEGLAAYREMGLAEPAAILSDIDNYRTDVDSVASFMRDQLDDGNLKQSPDARTKLAVVFGMYEAYCVQQHISALGMRRFSNRLRALGYESAKIGGVAVWKGLEHFSHAGMLGTL